MKMTIRAIIVAAATSFAAAGAVHAQDSAEMPSALECKNGYKDGMKWSKEDFEAACIKVTTNAVPAGQKK